MAGRLHLATNVGSEYEGKTAPPLPGVFIDLINTASNLIPPVFARPGYNVWPLTGNIPQTQALAEFLVNVGGAMAGLDPAQSDAQLVWQHFPPCYASLMTAQYGNDLAAFPFATCKDA